MPEIPDNDDKVEYYPHRSKTIEKKYDKFHKTKRLSKYGEKNLIKSLNFLRQKAKPFPEN